MTYYHKPQNISVFVVTDETTLFIIRFFVKKIKYFFKKKISEKNFKNFSATYSTRGFVMHFLPTLLMVADILTKVAQALAIFLHTDHLMGRMERATSDVFEAKAAGKWQTPGFEDLPEFQDSSSSEGSDSEEA